MKSLFLPIVEQLKGTVWYIGNKKDDMGLSIVIYSRKSNQYLSVACYRGEWSGVHGEKDVIPSILPKTYGKRKDQSNDLFDFDGPEDILPWLKENMDKQTIFKYTCWL